VILEKWELATSIEEKKLKTKFINLDHAENNELLNQLLLSFGCWLMLTRRFCVYNAGLKLTRLDCDYDIKWRKHSLMQTTHSSSLHVLFLAITLAFLGLQIHYRESWSGWYNCGGAEFWKILAEFGYALQKLKQASKPSSEASQLWIVSRRSYLLWPCGVKESIEWLLIFPRLTEYPPGYHQPQYEKLNCSWGWPHIY